MAQDLSERFSERAVRIVNEPLRSSSASPATREGKQKHSEAPLGDPGARDPAPSLAECEAVRSLPERVWHSSKAKHTLTIRPNNSAPRYLPKESENM